MGRPAPPPPARGAPVCAALLLLLAAQAPGLADAGFMGLPSLLPTSRSGRSAPLNKERAAAESSCGLAAAKQWERFAKSPGESLFIHHGNCKSTPTCRKLMVGQYKSLPRDMLPASGLDATYGGDKRLWARCAVVGNSGVLLRRPYGKEIDSHELVFRMNQAPTRGYENAVGKKTTHRLLNRAWTLGYAESADGHRRYKLGPEKLPVEAGVTLISSRTGPMSFIQMVHRLRRSARGGGGGEGAPPLYKNARALMLVSGVVWQAEDLLESFRKCMKNAKGGRTYPGKGTASSGLVAVVALARICKSVSVYGMGQPHHKGRKVPYQYYQFRNTERSSGNSVHAFQAELSLVSALSGAGLVRVCGLDGCKGGKL